jgi:hypothetical protein
MSLCGCSAYRPPTVRLAEVSMSERTTEGVTLQFAFDLHNPNHEALELIAFNYRGTVDGRTVYEGRWSAQATLTPDGGARLSIPVVVRYDRAGWAASEVPASVQCKVSGRLMYITPSELAETLLDMGVRRPRTRFSGASRVALAAGDG